MCARRFAWLPRHCYCGWAHKKYALNGCAGPSFFRHMAKRTAWAINKHSQLLNASWLLNRIPFGCCGWVQRVLHYLGFCQEPLTHKMAALLSSRVPGWLSVLASRRPSAELCARAELLRLYCVYAPPLLCRTRMPFILLGFCVRVQLQPKLKLIRAGLCF